MNCPCGEKAVSFGPFGNACPAHVPSTILQALRAGVDPGRVLDDAAKAGFVTLDLVNQHRSDPDDVLLARAVADHVSSRAYYEPRAKPTVRDPSLCSCGASASRWYEGGALCWFCVPRRTTPSERAIADLSVAWQANLSRVEAIARRQHHRRQVLGIAKQTKDQYPVALRDWELWQVAKVQEDGRLKDVLAKSRRDLTGPERTAASTLLAIAVLSLPQKRAEYLAELATKDLVSACREAGVACPATLVPVDPAPYFHVSADWDAAFYKVLQTVGEEQRMDNDAEYQRGHWIVIRGIRYQRGQAPAPYRYPWEKS